MHVVGKVRDVGDGIMYCTENNNNHTCLRAIFQDNWDTLVPECHHSGFYWS